MKFLGYAHCFMPISISQLKNHSISVYQVRYDTSVFANYIDTDTIKENSNDHKATSFHDITFTKEYAYTVDEKVEVLSREYNIHYGYFCGIIDLSFVYKSGFIF